MIKKLSLQNFTVFEQADLEFSPGLNVIIGENGTGKTHLLKLAYVLLKTLDEASLNNPQQARLSKVSMESYLADRLVSVFKPDKLGSLTSLGKKKTEVVAQLSTEHAVLSPDKQGNYQPKPNDVGKWEFGFSSSSISKVKIERYLPNLQFFLPVYLQAKEMVSFAEGFIGLYKNREVAFDETYYDLAVKLDPIAFREKPELLKQQIESITGLIGGRLEKENGRFYLVNARNEKIEINLVAEGVKKIATLLRLISRGMLAEKHTLLWDEPESNLNPRLIKLVARFLVELANQGVQVILATHSLFLLREIDMLTKSKNLPIQYIGLSQSEQGLVIEQSHDLDDIQTIVSLDEDLEQSDRYMNWDEEQANAGI